MSDNVDRIEISTRFDTLYSRHGWIAYDMLPQEQMLNAISHAENEEWGAGEQVLVNIYTQQFLESNLSRLSENEHFIDRTELAKLVMIDFLQGRFHSSVPNLLMLIDGLASDAAKTESFFSKNVDLSIWASMGGHSTGIPALGEVMRTPRFKRCTEQIDIPFRNGILHGRDLGFANKLVATKCWGALFALGEWAHKAKTEHQMARPPYRQMSLPGSPGRISDIPLFRDRADTIVTAKSIARWVPRIAPIVRLFGIDISSAQQAANEMSIVAPQLEQMLGLPDRFNTLYSRRGWIAYEMLNHQAMLNAVDHGMRGDLTTGERILVDVYNREFIEFNLARLNYLQHFIDRRNLARLTMLDFFEGRFHACVPNILILIDGLASDVAKTATTGSFFSESVDLTAWNSVEGHPTGLPVLGQLMRTPRTKRCTEQIDIPFRHGILHGLDLGFANKLVAAKCWGVLFALGEWARRIEQGQRTEQSPTPRKSLFDSFREIIEMIKQQQRFKAWRPRDLTVGVTLPRTGPSTICQAETPERLLFEFLELWIQRNYGKMAQLVTVGKRSESLLRTEINRSFRSHILLSFELISVEQRGPSATNFNVRCLTEGGSAMASVLTVVEHPSGELFHREWDRGSWKVYNWRTFLAHLPVRDEGC